MEVGKRGGREKDDEARLGVQVVTTKGVAAAIGAAAIGEAAIGATAFGIATTGVTMGTAAG